MRKNLIGMAAVVIGAALSAPATAQDLDGFLKWSHWQCERGDQESCRIHHLYRECEEGDRYACDEIQRERYFEGWQRHRREEFLRWLYDKCEFGDGEACRIYQLYTDCDAGNAYACEEILRERYHELWFDRDRDHFLDYYRERHSAPPTPSYVEPDQHRHEAPFAPHETPPAPAGAPPETHRHETPAATAPEAPRHQEAPSAPHTSPSAPSPAQPESHHHQNEAPAAAQHPASAPEGRTHEHENAPSRKDCPQGNTNCK